MQTCHVAMIMQASLTSKIGTNKLVIWQGDICLQKYQLEFLLFRNWQNISWLYPSFVIPYISIKFINIQSFDMALEFPKGSKFQLKMLEVSSSIC